MAENLIKKYKPKEFLENFNVDIKAENEELAKRFRKILENAKNIITKSYMPLRIFNRHIINIDDELSSLLSDAVKKNVIEPASDYFYKLLMEYKLNKLTITPKRTEELINMFNTIEKYSKEVSYNIIIDDSVAIDIYIEDEDRVRNIMLSSIGNISLDIDDFEFIIVSNIIQKKLKDYLKALII